MRMLSWSPVVAIGVIAFLAGTRPALAGCAAVMCNGYCGSTASCGCNENLEVCCGCTKNTGGGSGGGSNPLKDMGPSSFGKSAGDPTGFSDYARVEMDGAPQGHPFFSRNGAYEPQAWVQDHQAQVDSYDRRVGGLKRPDRGPGRDQEYKRLRRATGCFTVADRRKALFFSAISTPATKAEILQSTTTAPNEVASPISGEGQAITGAGAAVGPSDKKPPPTPESVGPNGRCRPHWWYAPETELCYGALESCEGDYRTRRRCIPQ